MDYTAFTPFKVPERQDEEDIEEQKKAFEWYHGKLRQGRLKYGKEWARDHNDKTEEAKDLVMKIKLEKRERALKRRFKE